MTETHVISGGGKIKILPQLLFEDQNHWRIIWNSLNARNKWEKLLLEAQKFSQLLEIEAVKEGLKDCAVVRIDRDDFESYTRNLTKNGLGFQLVEDSDGDLFPGWFGRWDKLENKKNKMWLIIARDLKKAVDFKKSLRSEQWKKVGKLLGYPDCCVEKVLDLSSHSNSDNLWFTVDDSDLSLEKNDKNYFYELPGNINLDLINPFKYMGINFLSYSPCSLDCQASLDYLDQLVELAETRYPEQLRLVRFMHRWPIKWSCLKGLVFVYTPVFNLEATSLPVFPELLIHMDGELYPEVGSDGVEFPWNSNLEKKDINFEF